MCSVLRGSYGLMSATMTSRSLVFEEGEGAREQYQEFKMVDLFSIINENSTCEIFMLYWVQ